MKMNTDGHPGPAILWKRPTWFTCSGGMLRDLQHMDGLGSALILSPCLLFLCSKRSGKYQEASCSLPKHGLRAGCVHCLMVIFGKHETTSRGA